MVLKFAIAIKIAKLECSWVDKWVIVIQFSISMKQALNILALEDPTFAEFQ